MTGVMRVKDNGMCQVGDYVIPGDNGLAIPSGNDAGYKVTARYSKNLIEVLMAHDAEMINRLKKEIDNLEVAGAQEVHIGAEEPTDEDVVVWIDTTEEADKIPTKTSELENDSGFITEIPEEYAKKTDIPDISNLAKKSDIPSIDGLATEEYVNTAIQNALEVVENGTY